jgi:hypothetical protein
MEYISGNYDRIEQMVMKLVLMSGLLWLNLQVSAQESLDSKRRNKSAVEYIFRAEKHLDLYFNIRGTTLTAEQRNAIAEQVMRKYPGRKSLSVDVRLGVDLISETLVRVSGLRRPPLWVVAGLHHQLAFPSWASFGDRGREYVQFLTSRKVVPILGEVVTLTRAEFSKDGAELYAELCSVVLKGLRAKSPVALRKMMEKDIEQSSTESMRLLLGVGDGEQLQRWFEDEMRKSARRRVLTISDTVEGVRSAVAELTLDSESETVMAINQITVIDAKRKKAFCSEILKLATTAPLSARPTVNVLAHTFLKFDDVSQLKGELAKAWKELRALAEATRGIDGHLGAADVRKRTMILQHYVDDDTGPVSRQVLDLKSELDKYIRLK